MVRYLLVDVGDIGFLETDRNQFGDSLFCRRVFGRDRQIRFDSVGGEAGAFDNGLSGRNNIPAVFLGCIGQRNQLVVAYFVDEAVVAQQRSLCRDVVVNEVVLCLGSILHELAFNFFGQNDLVENVGSFGIGDRRNIVRSVLDAGFDLLALFTLGFAGHGGVRLADNLQGYRVSFVLVQLVVRIVGIYNHRNFAVFSNDLAFDLEVNLFGRTRQNLDFFGQNSQFDALLLRIVAFGDLLGEAGGRYAESHRGFLAFGQRVVADGGAAEECVAECVFRNVYQRLDTACDVTDRTPKNGDSRIVFLLNGSKIALLQERVLFVAAQCRADHVIDFLLQFGVCRIQLLQYGSVGGRTCCRFELVGRDVGREVFGHLRAEPCFEGLAGRGSLVRHCCSKSRHDLVYLRSRQRAVAGHVTCGIQCVRDHLLNIGLNLAHDGLTGQHVVEDALYVVFVQNRVADQRLDFRLGHITFVLQQLQYLLAGQPCLQVAFLGIVFQHVVELRLQGRVGHERSKVDFVKRVLSRFKRRDVGFQRHNVCLQTVNAVVELVDVVVVVFTTDTG